MRRARTAGSSCDVAQARRRARATASASTAACAVPDPASRCNPDDVHGAERGGRPARLRLARRRLARPALGRGGDLRAARRHASRRRAPSRGAIERLDYLAELGVTAIELMPVADFPARATGATTACCRSRPTPRYGTPDDLKRAGRRGARARADGAARRRLQPLRPRRQLPARLRAAVLQPAAPHAVGRGDQFRRRAARARCATSSSTTRSTGSRSSTSTACASTPSHAIARRLAPAHSSTSSPQRVRDGRRRDAARPPRARERRATRRAVWRATRGGRPRRRRAQWNDDVHHALHVLLTGETRRLLRRLCRRAAAPSRPLRSPRASPTRASLRRYRGGAAARRAAAHCRRCVRAFAAEPRPGRQPRVRRAHRHALAQPRARCARALALPAAGAVAAAAVHGRGVRPPARRSCSSATSTASLARAVQRGPARRVRPLRRALPTRGSRAAIPDPNAQRHVSAQPARLGAS